jgi:hypothetical protein
MKIGVTTISVWLVFSLVVGPEITAVSLASRIPQRCGQQAYRGIDSRLKPDIVGVLPDAKQFVVGFELANHQPVIALADQVLEIGQNSMVKRTVPHAVRGISVDRSSRLLIQTDHGILTGDSVLQTNVGLTNIIKGRLYDSGSPLLLEVRSRDKTIQFLARRHGGQSFLIATFQGTFSAASWNSIGLVTVVEDSLYVWDAGSKKIVRLLTDRGLRSVKDVVLVGPERVIVTLKAMVILVTPREALVVAGIPSARCRFDAGVLYLLDDETGLVWALKGLDQLGTKLGDRAHAIDLLKLMPNQTGESSAQFLEAARILGCDQARREAASLKSADGQVTSRHKN